MAVAEIKTHRSEVSDLNDDIKIEVMDDAGPGGAPHCYRLSFKGNSDLKEMISFHAVGPGEPEGPNGFTNEAYLAVVLHRLESFQKGPYACVENEGAISGIKAALACLKMRTVKRSKAGIEGKLAAAPGDKEAMDELRGKQEAKHADDGQVGRIERVGGKVNFYAAARETGDQDPYFSLYVDELSTWGAWQKVEQAAKKLNPAITEAEIGFLGGFAKGSGANGFKEFSQAMQQHCGKAGR